MTDPDQLTRLIQLSVWQEFVSHMLALMKLEGQPFFDETEGSVAEIILSYGQQAPTLSFHQMLADRLFKTLSSQGIPLAESALILTGDREASISNEAKVDAPVFETLCELVELYAILCGAVAASLESEEKVIHKIIEGLAQHGHRFVKYVDLSVKFGPPPYRYVAGIQDRVLQAWFEGIDVTNRADEPEARGRYLLWVLEQQPRLARLIASRLMKLPPGNHLRDEERIRAALDTQLKWAVESAATSSDELRDTRATALDAMAGLIEHRLVSESRIDSLIQAGISILKTVEVDYGVMFRQAAGTYYHLKARKARTTGEQRLADEYDSKAVELLRPLEDRDTDPMHKHLSSVVLNSAAGKHAQVQETIKAMAEAAPQQGRSEEARLFALQMEAGNAFQRQQYDRVIELSSSVHAKLEERYLTAVLPAEVAKAGAALAEVSAYLTLAHAHTNNWENALTILDRAKSLRFRYQALVRSSSWGETARRLESEIHAHARGIGAPNAVEANAPSALTKLLEAYRQVREQVDFTELRGPGLAQVASQLEDDEAVVIFGGRKAGLLMVIVRAKDRERPAAHHFFSPDDIRTFTRALTDHSRGWLIALGHFAEAPTALRHLLNTTDRIIGHPLAATLRNTGVNRLTIIPHAELHLVPFWALPSLKDYRVMTAPSVAQLLAARAVTRPLTATALVVGNPTEDLKVAAVEAECVAEHLRKQGCDVELIKERDATEETLNQKVLNASILHFSGHSRSEMLMPTRSALEVNPGATGKTEEGEDLLVRLASQAKWQPVYRLAGTEWVENNVERWADCGERGHLEERFSPSRRRVELRLEHSATGTLLGSYEWVNGEDGAQIYGERSRLSELWSAGDILTHRSFRNCQLAVLSSCEAGAGGASFDVDEFGGLPAALQLAGVTTVVSPAWPVRVELAAVFADLFYKALTAASGEVDLLDIVHRIQQKLRKLGRSQVDAVLTELSSATKDRIARLLLDVTRRKIRKSDVTYPFADPYDWAAFQLSGSPTLILPFAGKTNEGEDELLDSPETVEASAASSVEEPLETTLGVVETEEQDATEITDPDNVFKLAEAAETLVAAASENDVIKRLAAEHIYERGEAHYRVNENDLALADFTRVVELDPSMVKSRMRLGQIYTARGDCEQALVQYEAALTYQSDDPQIYTSMGMANKQLNKLDAAVENFERALELAPNADLTWYTLTRLADIRLTMGVHDKAAAELTKALELRPEYGFAYVQRARASIEQDRQEDAMTDITRMLFFSSDSAIAFYLRGILFRNSAKLDLALEDFETALRIDPEMVAAIYQRGQTHLDRKEYAQALVDFDKVIQSRPEADVFSLRGLVHLYLGDTARGLADQNHALTLEPENTTALFNRACAHSVRKEAGSIVADLSAALRLDESLLEQARSDGDLDWARQRLPEVRQLLQLD